MKHIRCMTPALASMKSHRVTLFGSDDVNDVLDNIFGFLIDVMELKGKDSIGDAIDGFLS